MSKGIGNYIAAFHYFDKTLNVLFATIVVITTGIIKKYLKQHEIKKKHNMLTLSRSRLNSVESTISKVIKLAMNILR